MILVEDIMCTAQHQSSIKCCSSPSCDATSATKAHPATKTHLVVFVHGWKGNGKELEYLRSSVESRASSIGDFTDNIICYNSTANLGKTDDGIAKGGQRLANEINDQLNKIILEGSVLLSLVAYSLGGLYARAAVAHLDMKQVIPCVFCTIATPHTGLRKQTHVRLPNCLEQALGSVLGASIKDLFLQTPILEEMGTQDQYLAPLQKFQRRIALANAFRTDFLVPTTTAAFLSAKSESVHTLVSSQEKKHESYVVSLETERSDKIKCCRDMSQCLDALGWTKILLDVRDAIPFPNVIRNPFAKQEPILTSETKWTSQELMFTFDRCGRYWKLPLGHAVSCASSKNRLYSAFLTVRGMPIMDQLAKDLVDIMKVSNI